MSAERGAIVINCNDTGFALSAAGTMLYLQLKGLEFKCVPPKGGRIEDLEYTAFYVNGAFFCTSRIERDDHCLVQVVRRLGSAAAGRESMRLEIVHGRKIKRGQEGKLWIELDV